MAEVLFGGAIISALIGIVLLFVAWSISVWF